jgi:hypothetical protein
MAADARLAAQSQSVTNKEGCRLSMDVESKQGTYQAIFTPFIRGMLRVFVGVPCGREKLNLRYRCTSANCQAQFPAAAYPIAPGVG